MTLVSPGDAQGTRAPRWPALRDLPSLVPKALKAAVEDDLPLYASALAYYLFLAIPATLLLVVGIFSLVASPELITKLTERFGAVVPEEAVVLVDGALRQLEQRPGTGVAMTLAGLVVALWTTTSAMTAMTKAVNRAHEREDRRSGLEKRVVALGMVVALMLALLSVTVMLVLGSHLQRWTGEALGAERVVSWAWSIARWPILVVILFLAFSMLFALARGDVRRRWRVLSPGAAVAVGLWLLLSYGFGVYAANFGAYDRTWGSLSAAIVTLVWLWLSSLALLVGAEVDAEAERAAGPDRDDGTRAPRTRP